MLFNIAYLVLTFGTVHAKLLQGIERFMIDVDYGRFFGNDTLTYVEVYYAIAENTITYRQSGDKFVGGVNMHAVVKKGEMVVHQQEWTAPHAVDDTSHIHAGNNIVGLASFALADGKYECEVRAYDFYNQERADTILFSLPIQNFPTNRISLSDIEICTSIRQMQPDSANVFYKNTLEVIPNVATVFGSSLPKLHFYLEAYNLALLKADQYVVRVVVANAAGEEVFQHQRTKRRPGNSSVEVGAIEVSALAGGTYTMKFFLLDTTTNIAYTSSKKFFMYRPGEKTQISASGSLQVTESEFAIMEESELDEDFRSARYISMDSEIKEYEALSRTNDEKSRLAAKRNFLYSFWKKRAEGAGTLSRKVYMQRVENANDRFSGSFRKGWHTDRGRVSILYGEPSEIDRYPSTPESNPYEIWTYHQIQGGVVFVFVDRSGFGDWTLVHSTHRSELRDDNWQQYVRK
jgi:GWxTD domain-containing protein